MRDRPIPQPDIERHCWRLLERAADTPSSPLRLLTLATVDLTGRPDARLMTLRGADRSTRRLWMHTAAGSRKTDQLRACPALCLIAHEPSQGVQLRIRGAGSVWEEGELVERHAQQLERLVDRMAAEPERASMRRDPRATTMILRRLWPGAEQSADSLAVIQVDVRSIEWTQHLAGEIRRATISAGPE